MVSSKYDGGPKVCSTDRSGSKKGYVAQDLIRALVLGTRKVLLPDVLVQGHMLSLSWVFVEA